MPVPLNFYPAIVRHIVPETPVSKHIQIELLHPNIHESFEVPGQCLFIRVPAFKEGIFSLTNPPGEKQWSLLIKEASALTEHLLKLKKGETLQVSEIYGKGFNLKKGKGKDILLFAAGSGIAPLRSALWWIIRQRNDYKKITLFYGARNPNEFAYAREFKDWEKHKIKIIQTISNADAKNWQGPLGYVQDLVTEKIDGEKTIALLCGMQEMVEQTTQKLISLGLPKNHILTNY